MSQKYHECDPHHEYQDRGDRLQAYIRHPVSTSPLSVPAVLVCPDWSGRNPFADSMADKMAEWGYIGFAVDVYGEGRKTADDEQKAQWMTPFMQNRDHLLLRLSAAVSAIRLLPKVDVKRIAVVGFCFGGLCALDLARGGVSISGAVSIHGLFTPPAPNAVPQKIESKILALHGYDDPMVTPEQVNAFAQEMTIAKADWQLHVYGHTRHAFANPLANNPALGTVYNEVSATRAMRVVQDFLKEIFNV